MNLPRQPTIQVFCDMKHTQDVQISRWLPGEGQERVEGEKLSIVDLETEDTLMIRVFQSCHY